MAAPKRKRRLQDAYALPGFRPVATVRGLFGDFKARIIKLNRRSKKRCAVLAVLSIRAGTIARSAACVISPAETRGSISNLLCDASTAGLVAK
jgi:hypothetical protein